MHLRTPPIRRLAVAVLLVSSALVAVPAAKSAPTARAAAALPGRASTVAVPGTQPAAGTTGRPNVVLILTDDQRAGTVRYMPNVTRLLAQRGTTYTQAEVPTSLCCPSRSTILTGLYAHTSRLFGNGDVGGARYGGWRRFHRLGLEDRTMAPALKARGYRTA